MKAQRTLVFTDIVDSTAVIQQLGDEAAAALWADHDRRARALLQEHDGIEIDRSDGFFLLFREARSAARFVIGYRDLMSLLGLSARAGLHVGTVTLLRTDQAAVARGAKPLEVEGLAKPLAARIMALAAGGQVLLSEAAQAEVESDLPDGYAVQAHGHYRLKGIDEPQAVFELCPPGAAAVPPPDNEKAWRVVADSGLWRPARQIANNLVRERDEFVGRARELRQLARRLESGSRMVTLLGAAGSGKTRLVQRYAHGWIGEWPGGVWFCDLSEARSVEGIFFAVALALSVPLGQSEPVVQLGHAIAGRGRALVILDNFEQVADHASKTLGLWLDRAPSAAFVVTSRERLNLQGEQVFEVDPLALDGDAIDLFVVRAREQRPALVLDDTNRTAIAEAVALLDGLPLAIELAAARVRVLSPPQIVQRLRDRFSLLAQPRGAVQRQATLRAAIDWSWHLLAPWEQAALAQCSAFEGGFTLEAAEAVIDIAEWPGAPPIVDTIQALVDKSLLRIQHGRAGLIVFDEPFFGMLLSVHEYAAERLVHLSPLALPQTHRRHGEYYSRLGSDAAIDALSTHGGVRRWHAFVLEADNLAAACQRAVERGDAVMAAHSYRALGEVLVLHGPHQVLLAQGRTILEMPCDDHSLRLLVEMVVLESLTRTGRFEEALHGWTGLLASPPQGLDAVRRASIQVFAGRALAEAGRFDEAQALLADSLANRRSAGDSRGEALALQVQAVAATFAGRLRDAVPLLRQAVALFVEHGDRRSEARALMNLALVSTLLADRASARALHEAALVALRETGNRADEGIALGNLAILLVQIGQLDEAADFHARGLARCREVGYRRFEANALDNLASVRREQGRLDEAWSLAASAVEIHRELGNLRGVGFGQSTQAEVLLERGQLDAAARLFEDVIAIDLQTGDKRMLAIDEALLAKTRERQGAVAEALDRLGRAEALLREVGDRTELALVLCQRGRTNASEGDLVAAAAAYEEARSIAAEMGIGEDSLLSRALADLTACLESDRSPGGRAEA